MEVSDKGIEIVRTFEGCKLNAYLCPAGVLTIGYGHTGKDVYRGLTITQNQANDLLKKDLKRFEKGVESLGLKLTQSQFDALVSFAYNLGLGALSESTLVKKARVNPDDPAIRTEFMKWVNAGGKKLQGLVNRRKEEADLYFRKS